MAVFAGFCEDVVFWRGEHEGVLSRQEGAEEVHRGVVVMIPRAGRRHHNAVCVQEPDLDAGYAGGGFIPDTVLVIVAPGRSAYPSIRCRRGSGLVFPGETHVQDVSPGSNIHKSLIIKFRRRHGLARLDGIIVRARDGAGVALWNKDLNAGVAPVWAAEDLGWELV